MHSKIFFDKKINETINLINNNESTISEIMNHIVSYTTLNNFFIKINKDINIITKFLIKNKMNSDLFFIVINEINNLKGKYNFIYCNEYKLFMILQLEDNVNKWEVLEKLTFYSPENGSKRHYETIRSQFQRWCSKNIFKKALDSIIPYNNVKNNNLADDFNNINYNDELYVIDVIKDFFIDSTNTNNLRGSENIIINPELKKKKITKITEISDVDGFVVAVVFNQPLNKIIKYNFKNKEIQTAKHDSQCIEETLINKNKNIEFNNICLIGDKGYKIKNNNEQYKVVTPNKKNQKKNLINRHDKEKIKFRHIVENSINGWKHKERINLRKDKKISTFSGWVFLSILNHNLRVNEIKKKILNN